VLVLSWRWSASRQISVPRAAWARMSDPELIIRIKEAVTIPVMAKCRIGHFVEAPNLEAIGTDYIDESEVLTPADEEHHILKNNFTVPLSVAPEIWAKRYAGSAKAQR